jgi:hypothetical protein
MRVGRRAFPRDGLLVVLGRNAGEERAYDQRCHALERCWLSSAQEAFMEEKGIRSAVARALESVMLGTPVEYRGVSVT